MHLNAEGSQRLRAALLPVLAAAVVALALRLLFLAGDTGTDDAIYALRAIELAQGNWRRSDEIAELRFGNVLPMAAIVALFGNGATAGWSLLTSTAEVLSVGLIAGAVWGPRAALLAALLVAVVPMHIVLGGRSLADAPFAAFTTLAFAALLLARQRRLAPAGLAAGVAAGICWWIKPTAAMALFIALACYLALFGRRDAIWRWALLGAAAAIAAEWIFLWLAFDDPWLTLRPLFPFLQAHRAYTGDPSWGVSAPGFYAWRLLLDGRDMWLLPHLALAGACWLAIGGRRGGNGRPDVALWALLLLLAFSLTVISVNPVRFIPKQENYALVFVAPLALLATAALLRLPPSLQWTTLLVLAAGGVALAAVEQQALRAKASRLQQAAQYAAAHPQTPVYASEQTLRLARLDLLRTGGQPPQNLLALARFRPAMAPPGRAPPAADAPIDAQAVVVIERSSAEMARPATRDIFAALQACAPTVTVFASQRTGAGRPIADALDAMRVRLPAAIGRQLAFIGDAVAAPPADARRPGADCLATLPP